MATRTFKNAFLSVAAVDLSSHIASVAIATVKDTPEDTAMGDDSKSYRADGLRDATLSVTWNADDAAGAVSATLWTHYTAGTVAAMIFRPDAGVIGVTNPEYTFNAILNSDAPIGGAVGDLQTDASGFQVTGDVARATA